MRKFKFSSRLNNKNFIFIDVLLDKILVLTIFFSNFYIVKVKFVTFVFLCPLKNPGVI